MPFINRSGIKELIVKNIKNIVKTIGQSDYLSASKQYCCVHANIIWYHH